MQLQQPQSHSTAPARSYFTLAQRDSGMRAELESRIRAGFGQHFQACIEGFMPELAVYRHSSGAEGVIGIRDAAAELLFLESYLDRPIEVAVRQCAGSNVRRGQIAEVGQFVVSDRDVVTDFFRDLVPFLQSQGFDWVCFTGTNRIRALLSRMGFEGLPVANATHDRIVYSADDWGTYYEHEPVVVIGKLSDPQGSWFAHQD